MASSRVDISASSDNKIITNKFDFLLQEIDILFDTAPGEVLGDPDFGTDFEKFVWDLSVSNSEISEYVRNKIINNTMSGSDFDIAVTTTAVEANNQGDVLLVQISIKDPTTKEAAAVTYKID